MQLVEEGGEKLERVQDVDSGGVGERGGGVIAEEFGDVGVERQLMLFEQGVPSCGNMITGGRDKVDFGPEPREERRRVE